MHNAYCILNIFCANVKRRLLGVDSTNLVVIIPDSTVSAGGVTQRKWTPYIVSYNP